MKTDICRPWCHGLVHYHPGTKSNRYHWRHGRRKMRPYKRWHPGMTDRQAERRPD